MRVRATVKLRNDVMIQAREQLGLSQPKMAALIGVPASVYQRIEKLDYEKIEPGTAAWSHAEKIAGFIGVSFDQIVPDELSGKKVESTVSRAGDMDPSKLAAGVLGISAASQRLALPVHEVESEFDAKEALEQVMSTLSYREREVLKLRYGLGDGYTYSYEEIGQCFKVSRERAKQIEQRAVGRLQARAGWHPALKPFLEEMGREGST